MLFFYRFGGLDIDRFMIKDYALEALRLIFPYYLSCCSISLYLSYDLAINYNDDFVICFLLVMAVAFMFFYCLVG